MFGHLQRLPLDELPQTRHHGPTQTQVGAAQVGLKHTQTLKIQFMSYNVISVEVYQRNVATVFLPDSETEQCLHLSTF